MKYGLKDCSYSIETPTSSVEIHEEREPFFRYDHVGCRRVGFVNNTQVPLAPAYCPIQERLLAQLALTLGPFYLLYILKICRTNKNDAKRIDL